MALFTKTLKNNSGRIAIISDAQESFTYEWLLEKSDLFAREINVSKSLIFILSSNSVSSLVGYISSIENGHLALMIDNKINQILLNNLIENYKPNFLWVPSNISNLFPNNEIVFQFMNYDLILISENQVDFNPKLKLLLTTSGSTGSPKLVRLSEENLLSNAKSIIQYLNINESEKPVTLLPMHYSYGLSIINSHLLTGATILLTDKSIFQKELWELIKTHKATSISGVPFTYQMLKKLRIFRMDLPYLKTFTQAGGRLAKDIILDFVEYCEKANKRFITMYGQTEATARMSYLPFEKSRSKAGSIGIPIPGGHFKIINEHGDGVDEANVEGELVYFGRNVCLGYAEKINDLLPYILET
jgi:acyl-CoA synthetase (AMP-forming)/AMP-acid ligase II